MSTVETVRGPAELADLGPTLMHEHREPAALLRGVRARWVD
jgi:predicted metal-dependent phosphotriesterase family hydrolase